MYQVNLIADDQVIDAGHSENCKIAVHGAYQSLAGIRNAEVTVRRNGNLLVWMRTDARGDIDEIEAHGCDGTVHRLNPCWNHWPQFAV